MTIGLSSDTRLEVITRLVQIDGIRPIMFDRYAGDNETKLSWYEKIYLKPGTSQLVLPVGNIFSFYTAHNTSSAPKRLRDKRKFKDICNAIQSFVMFESENGDEWLPFLRDGKPIEVGDFGESEEPQSGIFLHRTVARLDKGIPNPKERPVLPLPWTLRFRLTIVPNSSIKESELRNLAVEGGLAIGLGTFRGQYGKFQVVEWSSVE